MRSLLPFLSEMLFISKSATRVSKNAFKKRLKNYWLEIVLNAKLRERYPVNKMPFENGKYFVSLVIIVLFAHGEFPRFCTLNQTIELSNSH